MSGSQTSPFTLAEVTHIVDQGFRTLFSEFKFRFVAELSQIKSTKGRYYLDLVQFDEQQSIVAKCRGIIFQASIIDKLIQSQTIHDVQDLKGAKLLMSGICNFHYEYGFSIIIQDISNEYLIGQFETLKKNNLQVLQDLGIVDANIHKQLGFPPLHIAIISSATSEGLKDFMTIIGESGYHITTELYPTMIHGNEAKVEVYQTLKTIYQDIQGGKHISLVAIIRGGGGSHGIMWQNDINIAKGICYMQVPVMIAIGHTSDQFLLNQLACFPAKTPSDGAHMLVSRMQGYEHKLQELQDAISSCITQMIADYHHRISYYEEEIVGSVSRLYHQSIQDLLLIESQIRQYDPVKILQQGYALIADTKGHTLDADALKLVEADDILILSTREYRLEIEVKSITHRDDSDVL